MAGKWCCGGGGGGGLTAITTADSPTVDLEGDGSAGAPLTATVLRSADPGNVLATGSDGALYVPTPTDTTNLIGVAGGAPVPEGSARSVDVDVVEGPPDTFMVGARLSPPWAQGSQVDASNNAGFGGWNLVDELAVPEDGVYLFEAFVTGYSGVFYPRANANYSIVGAVGVDGARLKEGVVMQNNYTLQDADAAPAVLSKYENGAVTFAFRRRLTAGQRVQGWVQFNGTYVGGDGISSTVTVAFNKISD